MISTAYGDMITAARIGLFLNSNGNDLERSYIKVASGKNVSQVSENVTDYFRAEHYSRTSDEYGKVTQSIDEVTGLIDYTEQSNRLILDDLFQMKGMVKDYYAAGATADQKATIEMQYNQAKWRISQTQDGASYDGREVLKDSSAQPLISVNTNPHEQDQRFEISFGADLVVDAMSLDITLGETVSADALDAEWTRAASFAAQLNGFRYGLSAQRKMSEVIAKGSDTAYNTIQSVDDAKEIMSITKKSIQQQAAMSMFAQKQMNQGGLLQLLQ